MRGRPIRFACLPPRNPSPGTSTDVLRPIHILHKPAGKSIFLACCFKRVTGRIVSRDGPGKTDQGTSSLRAHSRCVAVEEPLSPLHAAGYYEHSPILTSAESRSRSPVCGQQFIAGCCPIGLDALNRRK